MDLNFGSDICRKHFPISYSRRDNGKGTMENENLKTNFRKSYHVGFLSNCKAFLKSFWFVQ